MDVRFWISFPQKNAHLINVVMFFSSPCERPILELPSWTPGSYLIREYSRHIMKFSARSDGEPVTWKKVSKNNWELDVSKGTIVEVSYQVYSYEMTVRTNYIDNYVGLINGTATFFYPCDTSNGKKPLKDLSIRLEVDPSEFSVFTSLKKNGTSYYAENFDELYDSPIGLAVESYVDMVEYELDDIPCQLVLIGRRGNHDISALATDLRRIQMTSKDLFGELPYDRYIWLLYIRDSGGGGLEHKFSNVSIAPRWSFRKRENYLNVLRLESHEHFHVYNVKRIRPKILGPFDYEKEVYTKSLWIAEGLTNYYEKKILLYSGIFTLEDYFNKIEKAITDYLSIPGRFETSVAESSFDAWIKLYRPNENSPNSVVSYYLKGGLVGLLLDIEIREKSGWEKSLDDVFVGLYQRYKEDPDWGYSDDEFPDLVKEFSGVDITDFYQKYVTGVDELPFEDYLPKIGVALKNEKEPLNNLAGVKFEKNTTRIRSILNGSPALEAGLSPGDEIVSLAGYKFTEKTAEEIIQSADDGQMLEITFFHDGIEIRSEIQNVKTGSKIQLVLPQKGSDDYNRLKQYSKIRWSD